MSSISRSDLGMRDLGQTIIAPMKQNDNKESFDLNQSSVDQSDVQIDGTSRSDKDKLIKAIDHLNESMKADEKSLRFKYDDKAGSFYVEVVNQSTQEVIDTLPPKYLIDLSIQLKDMIGMFIDKKL